MSKIIERIILYLCRKVRQRLTLGALACSAPQARYITPHAIGTRLSLLRMEKRYVRYQYDQGLQRLVVQ